MHVQVCVIHTYVFTSDCIGPTDLSDKFCSIESDLYDVIEQSKCWCQREGGHEQRHEPILDYCRYEGKHMEMTLCDCSRG